MNKTKMQISDVTGLTSWTLTVDVYDATTHTTSTVDLGDISSILQDIITRKYNHRYFYYTGSQPSTTPTTAFKLLWDNYKILKSDTINNVFQALVYSRYDPTENVFEYSHTENKYGDIDVTSNIGEVETETQYGAMDSSTQQGKPNGTGVESYKTKSTQYSNTYDNTATDIKQGYTENESDVVKSMSNVGQHTDTTTQTQTEDTTQKTERGNDEVTLTRHGNVGTVASIDMILKELSGRRTSFYEWLCADFIGTYTYYTNLD